MRLRQRPFSSPCPALLTGACVALLAGCGTSSASGSGSASPLPVPVVTSTAVYGDVVERIGAGKVKVTSFISDPEQDPHSYEASARDRLRLSEARLVVENGGGYDDFMDRMSKTGAGTSPRVIDAVEVSGRTAPAGGSLNEHVWYDFPTMSRLADRTAAALATADPGDSATFTRNAAAFKAALKPLETKEAQIKAAHAGEAVAITEPVPLYMIEAAGLRDATPAGFSEAIEEGTDVSPGVLRETLALFSAGKVKALVSNEQTAGPQTERAERAANDAHVPVVPVTETLPDGEDYLAWMTSNVDALARALDR